MYATTKLFPLTAGKRFLLESYYAVPGYLDHCDFDDGDCVAKAVKKAWLSSYDGFWH